MRFLNYIFLFSILAVAGCRNGSVGVKIAPPEAKREITRAERFNIETKDSNLTVLRIINPWQGSGNINLTYYLLKRGSAIPEGIDTTLLIFVPLKKIICMSTTHTAMISALGEEASIAGVSGTGFVFSESLNVKIDEGFIKDVGYEASLNNELILKISPDLIMMYGIGGESAGYVNKIRELGVKVMFNADYLETDPLGKAEWIRLFGALYCKENMADSIYRSEVEQYEKLKDYIGINISSRPEVLLGLPYKDTWYISPGNSYISRIISDAGGNYLWKDMESEISMPLGIENVYLHAMSADFWLNIGTAKKRNDIAAVDHRLASLPCFKNGNLFNNINRMNLSGGNDYWENGTTHPHLVLKDIATILHPELFGDDELYFYRKIQ